MSEQLFPHQLQASAVLQRGSAMLDMEVRTGKTRAVLHAWNERKWATADLVVVTLKSVRSVWQREARAMGLDVQVIDLEGQTPRLEALAPPDGPATVYVLTWAILPAWQHLLASRCRIMVYDESHLNLRNPANQRYKAAALLSAGAERTWLLTGTPKVKSAEDLYWQLRLLGRDNPFLGWSITRFRTRYCQRRWNQFIGKEGNWEYFGIKNEGELAGRLTTTFSVTQAEVFDVKPPIYLPIWLDAGIWQDAEGGMTDQQVNSHLQNISAVKADQAVCYVEKLRTLRPIVVFAWFKSTTRQIAEELEAPVINGDTSRADRDRLQQDFQAGKIPVLVVNYLAGGLGIELSAARHAVMAEPWYDEALVRQAMGRLTGPRQPHHPVFHWLLLRRTVDEYVWAVRLDRGRKIDQLRHAMKEAAHTL